MTNVEVLKKHFGFDNFKDIQEPVINNLLAGNNSLCLMPTGGGKSIIYQVAGLQTGKITIVISPLLALMKQQNKRLIEQGINTLSYNSSIGDVKAQFNKLRKIFSESELPKFLFVSPEKILSDGYLEYLLKKHHLKIGLIVVDEAHCISQWGHTFRPSYKAIPYFISSIFGTHTVPPVLCLTATLNPHDKDEICNDLKISEENIFVSKSLVRDNLKLVILEQVENNEEKKAQLIHILKNHEGEKIIVYTHIKAREYGTREMTECFQALGYNCNHFDADMSDNEKLSILEKFETGDVKIIFATSAFGMGIDIPDIRVVVHYLVPESIEQYYQEVGRAGRDNKQAYGYLLYSETNFKVRRDLIKKSLIKPVRIKDIFEETIQPTATNSNNKLKKKVSPIMENLSEKIYSISRMDIKEDNSEMIIFLYLLAGGIIKLQGKGVQFFDCFEDNSRSMLFSLMKDASVTGMVSRISKKLNKSIQEVNYDIFTLFNQGEINLTRVPMNVLNYSVASELTEELGEQIYNALRIRTENRMANFEKLANLINKSENPLVIIKKHLGIS